MDTIKKVYCEREEDVDFIEDLEVTRYTILHKERSAYGVLPGDKIKYKLQPLAIFGHEFKIGGWYTSEAFVKGIGTIGYPRGFHVFETEKEAIAFSHSWSNAVVGRWGRDKWERGKVIAVVKCNRLIAEGYEVITTDRTENGQRMDVLSCPTAHHTLIYHKRMIVRELPWPERS
jgi:hypothetical protein